MSIPSASMSSSCTRGSSLALPRVPPKLRSHESLVQSGRPRFSGRKYFCKPLDDSSTWPSASMMEKDFMLRSLNWTGTDLFICPQFIEKTALRHLIEIAPVDHFRGLDVFRPRFSFGDVFKDRLNSFGLDLQTPLHDFDFRGVRRLDNLLIGDAEVLAEDLESEFLVAVQNLRGF